MRFARTMFRFEMILISAFAFMVGCRGHMPHSLTWPAGGDTIPTHPKPPEGGYYSNWDPYAVELTVEPVEDVNPVRTQHVVIATVLDKKGRPLPNRRVEWIVADGSVGDIIEVDESGWRASRGYKMGNNYAVSHTNNFGHVLTRGNDDPSDDIVLKKGQTWCVITSAVEGDTHLIAYAPGIYDWDKHKAFATKHWYDVHWEFPPPATNPVGEPHQLVTVVTKHSDGTPLPGYLVTYRLAGGPSGSFEGGGATRTVETNGNGEAITVLSQATPAEGTNQIEIDVMRPANASCCEPAVHIATGSTVKNWIGPEIAIEKTCVPEAMVGDEFTYDIVVSNPSDVAAKGMMVSDSIPSGIEYVSSSPSAQGGGGSLSWSLGDVEPRGQKQISVRVRATRDGTFENCADVRSSVYANLAANDCCTTRVVSPALALEKTCTPRVTVCDPIQYTVVVRNTGQGPAQDVQINDSLPAGLTTTDGQTSVTANIGTLAAGEARQVTFSAKASRSGNYTNTASASGAGGLSAQDSCSTVVTQPVLEVDKTAPATRFLGRNVEYSITVRNTGDSPANNTMLTDTLAAGTSFVSASDGGQLQGGSVGWSLGTIDAGQSRTVTLTVLANQAGMARNTATATAICAEDSDSAETSLQGIPAILLEVVDIEDPIEVGTNVTYVITVTNQGSSDGTNITIEAVIPPNASFVSATGATNASNAGQNVTFVPLPSLAPKAKAVFRVTMRGNAPADSRFKVVMRSDQTTSSVEETEATNIYE